MLERLAEGSLLLLSLGSILFLTYITTRYVGKKASKSMRGKYVTIVETVSLGMDKRLHLVKAGNQYLLLASTSKTLELVSEVRLEEDEAVEGSDAAAAMANVFDFKSVFEKYSGLYKSKKKAVTGQQGDEEAKGIKPEGERFRNNLDRLMNITRDLEKQGSKNGDEFTNEK